jgi:hypothetical protein
MGTTSIIQEEIMQSTHPQPIRESQRPGPIRTAIGRLLVVLASALTLFTGWGVYDAITGDYVGAEVDTVWYLVGFAAVLTGLVWAAAIAFVRHGRS